MAIDFPANPTTNDTFTVGSITYKWDGAKWIGLGVTPTDRLIEGNNKLEIDASNNLIWTGNNVGIDTTNPSSPLHIGQSTDNAVTAGITLKNNPSIGAQRFTLYNEEDVGTHYNSNDEGIARAHIFETGGTQRLLITTDKVMFSVDAKVDANNTRDLGASGAKWKDLYLGSLASIGGAQFNGNITPSSGEGVEIFQAATAVGVIQSYDRSNSDWDALRIKASQLEFSTEGTERLRITSSGVVLPGADATQDLGSATKRWANIYSADLQLSNEGAANEVDGTWGNYTIQEGEDDLFLINRRSSKKYKFNLTEVA